MEGLLGGSLQRRRWIVSVFSGFLGENGFLCAGWYIGINWLATVLMVRTDRIGQRDRMGWTDQMGREWDVGGVEGPVLAGSGSGAPPLSLEVQATGIGGRQWEKMAATNCVVAARAQIICVIPAE